MKKPDHIQLPKHYPQHEHTCRDCGVKYMHRKQPTYRQRKDGSVAVYWMKSQTKTCKDCRPKKALKALNAASKAKTSKYPPSMACRPCQKCGKDHDHRRPDRRFYEMCQSCRAAYQREWRKGQVLRQVESRLKREITNIEQAQEAKRLMGFLVDIVEQLAPGNETMREAETFLRRWHP